jgi:hypothetical protein
MTRLLLVPFGVGVGIGIGIDSDWILWGIGLVLTTETVGPAGIRDRCTLYNRFLVSKSLPLSFDSDSDTDPDPDPDYNPYRDRDAFVLY